MSVINQMLKDLEDRQPQHGKANNSTYITTNKSPLSLILLIIVILCILNIAGYFIWSLYSENQLLKQDQQSDISEKTNSNVAVEKVITKIVSEEPQEVIPTNNIEPQVNAKEDSSAKALNKNEHHSTANAASTIESPIEQAPAKIKEQQSTISPIPEIKVVNEKARELKKVQNKDSVESFNDPVNDKANQATKTEKKPASLVISRKKMTADELVAQKLEKAQRAINGQKIAEAESLFEEVLLLKPSHQYARKQLAALWYGRKSYQAAINLLQQGIANVSDNAEYRLMQARIYNELGRYQQAFETLSVLPNEANNDYQAMLANTAQQLGKHQEAISAYGYLAKNEPTNARWWLGLAISYDSNSQFSKAIDSYKLAIIKQGLSANTRAFAQQRIIELGE